LTAGAARAIARRWVAETAGRLPGFVGAYFIGSTATLADDAPLAAGADVDLTLAFEAEGREQPRGKREVEGVIIDVSHLPASEFDADRVLANYHRAPALAGGHIIADPTERLTALHGAVAARYDERAWVERRCEDAAANVRRYAASFDRAAPYYQQAFACLFAAGVITHILLVAGLRNPTVRRRYVATRELLDAYGIPGEYRPLLALLGAGGITPGEAGRHLRTLEASFDAAAVALRTPLGFMSDITVAARSIAVDGSRAMIEDGDHGEAMFWIAVTHARCLNVLAVDGSQQARAMAERGLRDALTDLGIESSAGMERRLGDVGAALPAAMDLAARIMDANPQIRQHGGRGAGGDQTISTRVP